MTLTYLTNQSVYVGSHLGDSQLVQVSPSAISAEIPETLIIPPDVAAVSASSVSSVASSRKGKEKAAQNDMEIDEDNDGDRSKGRVVEPQGTYINVLETYKNIGPIMDAISVDIDGSGQVKRPPHLDLTTPTNRYRSRRLLHVVVEQIPAASTSSEMELISRSMLSSKD